jgi:hypothetical protein
MTQGPPQAVILPEQARLLRTESYDKLPLRFEANKGIAV